MAATLTTTLVARLIAAGSEGVTLGSIAAEDPATRERLLDFRDFDSDGDQSDVVYDLGPRGIDVRVAAGAAQRAHSLLRLGAVLDSDPRVWEIRYGSTLTAADLDARVRLVGWSGMAPVHRLLPTLDELQLPAVDRLAAFLSASGPGATRRENVAWWAAGTDLYFADGWDRAAGELAGRGWDVRRYFRASEGQWVQAAATPDHPMRPPDEPCAEIEQQDFRWPDHGYRYSPELWAAVCGADDNTTGVGSWTGGRFGRRNPLRSYGGPAWYGQPLPGGEERRSDLLAWAVERGWDDVMRMAVPGSVELVTDPAELDAEPVGLAEIAERLGVARQTVDSWRSRGLLPEPRWSVGGRPAWEWATIAQWARDTGRRD